jgi:hypothetical protein
VPSWIGSGTNGANEPPTKSSGLHVSISRLVARTLERAWEEKLAAQQQLEEEYHRFVQHKPRLLSEDERETIRRLATDIPTLWAAPTTTAADRKEIVRKAR